MWGAFAPSDFVGKIFRTCSTKRPSITAWPQKDFQTFLRPCDGSLAISCRPRRSSNAVETFFKPHIIFCTLSKISQIIFGLKNEKMSREIVKGVKAISVLNPLVYLVTIHAIWKKLLTISSSLHILWVTTKYTSGFKNEIALWN